MYREFREEKDLVSLYTLDILQNMIYCLILADRDDPSLGNNIHSSAHHIGTSSVSSRIEISTIMYHGFGL